MKKNLFFKPFITVVLCSLFFATALPSQTVNEPVKNFEHLWKAMDMNYAVFGPKNIDWRALYHVYRPRVTPQTTDDELFQIMSGMLGHLNDNHVRLTSRSPERFFSAGFLNTLFGEGGVGAFRAVMSVRPVPAKYFKTPLKELAGGMFAYGWAADGVGYFHFRGFGNIPKTTEIIDTIIKEFKDAKAVIVDVRRNGGGDDRVGKLIADRFAARKRLYMTTQIRSGLKHTDFTPKKYWYVEPGGPAQFTRPVILLTDRLSISAAENFALAMRILPNVTVVGDFTSGCFADMYRDTLPNGWGFSVSYKLFLDYTGFCWEGIGVPPDIMQRNSKADEKQQKDRVFELALSLIDSGKLKPLEESAGLKNIREFLSKTLAKDIQTKGLDAAVQAFRAAKKEKDPGTYTVDPDEMGRLGERLIRAGKHAAGLRVLELNAEEFPALHPALFALGKAYMSLGKEKQALEYFEKSNKLNQRRFPPELGMYFNIVLSKALMTGGTDAVVREFRALKKQYGYRVNENLLNGFGYFLLGIDKKNAAIAAFQLNVETYPDYANGFDSLAEAYMKNGDETLAIKNYEKALKMDPKNNNAEAMLKKLRKK